jgi:cbb3-type cytochrome oxidase maturation protein
MDIIYLLIPVSLVLIGLIVWAFLWAIQSGQFEDLEGPAHKILMEEDEPMEPRSEAPEDPPGKNQ